MSARGRGAGLRKGTGVSGENESGEGMCLGNMVRTCLIYGMGKSSSEPLKLLIGSFPGRRVGRVVIFLHDGKPGKKPAGVAAGLRRRHG